MKLKFSHYVKRNGEIGAVYIEVPPKPKPGEPCFTIVKDPLWSTGWKEKKLIEYKPKNRG